MKSLRCLVVLVALAVTAGCGQKGDLYFPERQAAATAMPGALEHYGPF